MSIQKLRLYLTAPVMMLHLMLYLLLCVFPQVAQSAEPVRGDVWRDPSTGMEFRWVPGGCFKMGSDVGIKAERPVHRVCVKGFWMGKNEVTQAQWTRVTGSNPSEVKEDAHPVNNVSWNEAQAFIRKLNGLGSAKFRLPSEAEWEYACRSGKSPEHPSGHCCPVKQEVAIVWNPMPFQVFVPAKRAP
jgi:formylglycine-generating enzyme required for sulfatase activity